MLAPIRRGKRICIVVSFNERASLRKLTIVRRYLSQMVNGLKQQQRQESTQRLTEVPRGKLLLERHGEGSRRMLTDGLVVGSVAGWLWSRWQTLVACAPRLGIGGGRCRSRGPRCNATPQKQDDSWRVCCVSSQGNMLRNGEVEENDGRILFGAAAQRFSSFSGANAEKGQFFRGGRHLDGLVPGTGKLTLRASEAVPDSMKVRRLVAQK
jgi:hypothetical protein